MVAVIDNGSDAPGTILDDCSEAFLRCYHKADLIIAKGQGNFETLSDAPGNIFFFLKAKCPVIAAHVGQPVGTHILACSHAPAAHTGRKSNTIIEQAKHSPGSAGHHQGETNHETT
jgi:damage-control phosphatase, subfamily I